uniref:Saposin B-type domain-containing protein n=1 Tax=Heterorhabditis bacteriophora TaxID=37862 RepID=A0A1I7WDU5_HETBA
MKLCNILSSVWLMFIKFMENKESKDHLDFRVNEVASVSCDVCLSAVYGINYNVIRLKKAAEDMIRLDCEALFHGQPEDIGKCIKIVVDKIEDYYNKVRRFYYTLFPQFFLILLLNYYFLF